MEWIWDLDKRKCIRKIDFLLKIDFWHILETEAGCNEVIAVMGGQKWTMTMFRGTEQECQEYIDEQAD